MRKSFSIALGLLFLSITASAVTPEREGTRVEVISPSTPVLDDFTMTYIVARRGAALDSAFRGEVWMWTDGSWIRPYHVRFTPADRGQIAMRMQYTGAALQRIETYELGLASAISVWGNPVLPVAPGAPRLLWGALDRCDQPGLDFCLSESGQPPALPGSTAIGLRVSWKEIKGQKVGSIILDDPAAPASDALPPQLVGVDAKSAGAAAQHLSNSARNLLPIDGGLIGVWVDEATPAGIFAALARGRSYAAWGGRMLIVPGKGRALVAGYGPRLTVTLSGGANPTRQATDDFHLTANLPAGNFILLAEENGRLAVALDRLFQP